MNQFTKGVVIASTMVAALVELYLATAQLFPEFFTITLAAFVAAAVVGTRFPGPPSRVILFAAYLTPAAFVAWAGFEHFSLEIVWALPLLGLAISGKDGWRWNLPERWRWPLVAWALILAASWPFVFLREIDFDPSILPLQGVSNTSIGISPWDSALGVTYRMLVQSIGLLWLDRLFGWYSNGRLAAFRAHVLLPLAAALAVACVVGGYQGFVDLTFLNPHDWPHLRRAAGTLGDANAFGVVAGLWGPAFIVLARSFPRPWSIVVGIAGVSCAAVGVLTSGSRTALVTMSLGLAAVAFESVMAWRKAEGSARLSARRLAPIIGGALVLMAIALVVGRNSSIISVVGRGSLGYVPFVGDIGIRETARELLWDRFGYGPPAVQMIREHPWSGIGIGTFHTLVHDFAVAVSGKEIPPDNAQSWYRHLLAELGFLGSLPWIAWCVVFLSTLVSRATKDRDRFTLGVLRGALAGFGIASLLGMPAQSLPVVLTFWTLAFWFALVKGVTAPPTGSGHWSPIAWGATFALVIVHATITYADARGDLRPRHRSMRFGWDYRYGISDLERSPDGSPGRRWTELTSLSVIPVKGKVLKFVGWIDHPDADERPVHVRVWADSTIVYDDDLKRSAAIFLDIPATPGKTHMVVQTEISRMWKPRDFGRDDPRELGLSVRDWTWE
jgi:hypothetical protein